MAAGKYTLSIEPGVSRSLFLRYRDALAAPVNLTGYSAKLQIRPYLGSTTVWLTLESEITLGGVDGTILVEASAIQTALVLDNGVYDLVLIDANEEPIRLLKGKVQTDLAVTEIEDE